MHPLYPGIEKLGLPGNLKNFLKKVKKMPAGDAVCPPAGRFGTLGCPGTTTYKAGKKLRWKAGTDENEAGETVR
ncbi:hypothetical protein [Flaviaesturariibacter flavus]|uniref:hypothetical protein n=1 Tax=Flaviaesturariibacter flavus TaxID=2502780 RepID=UPI0010407250|nr:hypothetical protein [Flaviaesturariibacter flavus]